MTDFRLGASRHPPNFLGSLGACQIEILERNESHMSNHPPYHIITYACDDMSLRQSFSGFRKKVKEKLSKIGDGTDKRRVNVGGEGFNHSALSLQSEPGVVVGGEFGVGKDDLRPDDSRSVSQSVVGTGLGQGGSDDMAGGEINQQHLHPRPYVQTGSGSGRERMDADGKRAGRANPPLQLDVGDAGTLIPSISRGSETKST